MSTDNDVPWSGPEPDDPVEPWAQDEPPSRPLPPSKRDPFFRWIGSVVTTAPKCPRCAGVLEYRRKDEAGWCRPCARAFYHRSVQELLTEAGIWFL